MAWLRLGEGHTMAMENEWFRTPMPHFLAPENSPVPERSYGPAHSDNKRVSTQCKYCREGGLFWSKKGGRAHLVDTHGTKHDCQSFSAHNRTQKY